MDGGRLLACMGSERAVKRERKGRGGDGSAGGRGRGRRGERVPTDMMSCVIAPSYE